MDKNSLFCSWNYTIAQIGIGGSEALAFANYFMWLLKALHIDCAIDTRIIATILMVFFVYINYRGIEIAGKWQNAFMFFFWGASLVWFAMVVRNMDFTSFSPVLSGIPANITALAKSILMIWWCFAGFETVVGMGAEVKYPQITIPRALCISPFIVFGVNALFQWFLIGLTPAASLGILATTDAPFAVAMEAAGIVGIPLVILCLGITFGGDFSTMNPCVTGPARYMYVMANDGSMPRIFGQLHPKYKSPYVSVIVVGLIAIALIATGFIAVIAAMCAFCQMTCYIIGYISYLMLQKKEPNLERPYKVPAGKIAAIISIVVYLGLMILALDRYAIPFNIGFDIICVLYYFMYVRKRPIPQESVVAWDKKSKKCFYNVIVWQDSRTSAWIENLKKDGLEPVVQEKTCLPLDSYFPASKMRWILDNVPEAKTALKKGRLCMGTMDSFFIHRLTNVFSTDYNSASRTCLFNVHTLAWDRELCDIFGVPMEVLPPVVSNLGDFGFFGSTPVTASIIDQFAGIYGHGCRKTGDFKFTFGTGGFMQALSGESIVEDKKYGLLPCLCWKFGNDAPMFGVDGGIYNAASAINWARSLTLFDDYEELNDFSYPTALTRGPPFSVRSFFGIYSFNHPGAWQTA